MSGLIWETLLPIFSHAVAQEPSAAAAASGAAAATRYSITVSLDSLSSLAGLAAALSLAYAALPNFRHRIRVQDHIRNKIIEEELVAVLKVQKDLCTQESWAILFRLGRLRDVKQTQELFNYQAPRAGDIDRNFRKRVAYIVFSQIYASNFDKIIAGVLGALASTIIWFGAIDNIHYHDLGNDNAARVAFFARIQAFYWASITLIVVIAVAHKILWRWDMRFRGWRSVAIHIIGWIAAVMFLLCLIGASSEVQWFERVISATSSTGEVNSVFFLSEAILLVAILVPLLLLAIGELLTAVMLGESDRCVLIMLELFDARAGTAGLRPALPSASPSASPPQNPRGGRRK